MPAIAPIYRFGPFELRTASSALLRDGEPLAVVSRHAAVLSVLLTRAGRVVSKDDLMTAGWKDEAVGPSSLDKAISDLRRALGDRPDGGPYIETIWGQGFRFTAAIAVVEASTYEAFLAPHLLGVEGRAAIETLSAAGVAEARAKFEEAVRVAPAHAPAHVGLAMACGLQFDATRSDAEPNFASLALGVKHVLLACELDPAYPGASSARAFVLSRAGHRLDALGPHLDAAGVPRADLKKMAAIAVASARQATWLESENWRNDASLAAASWGEEALAAFRRTVSKVTTFPLAYVLAARILIARQQFAHAERELVAGIASDEGQRAARGPFGGAGVHLLYGLVRLSALDRAGAEASFDRELASESDGHVYAREIAAHTWHAKGAMRLHADDAMGAAGAFQRALDRVPAHALAHAGLVIAKRRTGEMVPLELPASATGGPTELAFARAALLVEADRAAEAAALVADVIAPPDDPSAGWMLPVEPLLDVMRAPDVWRVPLAKLRARAM